MTPRQRDYVVSHAARLAIPDLARGARLPEKVVRALLKEARFAPIDAPRQSRLPPLYPQLPLPEGMPPSRADRRIALGCAAISFLVFAFTTAREVTGGNAGELVASARTFGVAHPPGFPLWCLLAGAASWLPVGSAAFRVALFSAACAAGAVFLLVQLVLRLTRSRPASAASGLLFAFSAAFWPVAVVPEVHALTVLLLAATLYLGWRWYEERTNGLLFGLATVLGLALTNQPSLWPVALVILAFVVSVHWTIWQEPGLLPLAFLFAALPLALFFYIPLRAEAGPLVNWGNPRGFEDVVDHVLGMKDPAGSASAGRSLAAFLGEACGQWPPWLGWIALPGAWLAFRRQARFGALLFGIFAVTATSAMLLHFDLADRARAAALRPLFLLAWLVAAVWIGLALAAAAKALARAPLPRPEQLAWAACGVVLFPLCLFWRGTDRAHDRAPRQYAEAILDTLPPHALFLAGGDHAAFPILYLQAAEGRRRDVTIVDKYGFTDQVLRWPMPGAVTAGVGRIPTAEEDERLQAWLLANTDRPVYATQKRSLAALPGAKWVQEGILFRLVREKEAFTAREDLWEKYDLGFLADRPPDEMGDAIAWQVLLARGAWKAARGDKGGAKADFDASAAATRGVKQGLNNLGSTCADAGLLDEAANYLEEALALDPKYASALRNLALVQVALKRWKDAKATLDRLLALNPKDTAARYQLVDLYRAQGNARLAIFELEKIAKDDPKNPAPLEAAGNLSQEEGDSLGALTYFQRAMSLDPTRLDLLDKVQGLLSGGLGQPGGGRDPFGAAGMPRVPRAPDPFRDLFPDGFRNDPLDRRRRR